MPTGEATAVSRILDAMERAGLLMRAGWRADMGGLPMMGQLYISQGKLSAQMQGNLWLSEVIGPDLIIESYKAVTVLISGGEGAWGTGLVLDRTHVVTNKHVLKAVAGPGMEITAPFGAHPVSAQFRAKAHRELDVAVIELKVAENEGFAMLPGMVFRDPAWADEIYLLGYPRVPWMVGTDITLQRGEVVNPLGEAPAVRDDDTEALDIIPSRTKMFLYSATARPGNSGGPIIAHDGRVIGLVVEDSAAYKSTDPRQHQGSRVGGRFPTLSAICSEVMQFATGRPDRAAGESRPANEEPPAAPFYRGIPASEVVRAIDELGFTGLAVSENPV